MKTSGIIQKPVLHTFSAQPRAVRPCITHTSTKSTEEVFFKKMYTNLAQENAHLEGLTILLEELLASSDRKVKKLSAKLIEQQG